MQAVVLERRGELSIREVELPETMGSEDVRIKVHTVGICGSDVHYFTHGRIGAFAVNEPMVLGHEASGIVVEVGQDVKSLAPGDRVCMEPGIPDLTSKAAKLGIYNVDPAVTFWATPPIHGCLAPYVVHPAAFTYKLPDNVSFAEGAMVEPLAVGLQASVKARIVPGDVAVVVGAGPIGIMIALAALSSGCSKVIISDLMPEKLAIAGRYPGITAININTEDLSAVVADNTDNWGADIIFEASGSPQVYSSFVKLARPGGCVVIVGMPVHDVQLDITSLAAKELRLETVYRYANVFDRALKMIASGGVDLKPLISATFPFGESVAAFQRAAEGRPGDVKLQILVNP